MVFTPLCNFSLTNVCLFDKQNVAEKIVCHAQDHVIKRYSIVYDSRTPVPIVCSGVASCLALVSCGMAQVAENWSILQTAPQASLFGIRLCSPTQSFKQCCSTWHCNGNFVEGPEPKPASWMAPRCLTLRYCEIINICCFQPLNCGAWGVVYYKVMDY